MGIIACVEVSTTTVGTAPGSTTAALSQTAVPVVTTVESVSTPAPPTSGTTTVPTSVTTTTVCQKDMAVVGGQYVSSVTYSVSPVDGTNNDDLTNTASNGITFTPVSSPVSNLFDANNQPLYQITITFNRAGVDSLGSITSSPTSNVNRFAVLFFTQSNPNQPVTLAPELADKPVELISTIINSRPAIVDFPAQLPSPISAIRILILSTSDNQ